jgi:hypothetical protein
VATAGNAPGGRAFLQQHERASGASQEVLAPAEVAPVQRRVRSGKCNLDGACLSERLVFATLGASLATLGPHHTPACFQKVPARLPQLSVVVARLSRRVFRVHRPGFLNLTAPPPMVNNAPDVLTTTTRRSGPPKGVGVR